MSECGYAGCSPSPGRSPLTRINTGPDALHTTNGFYAAIYPDDDCETFYLRPCQSPCVCFNDLRKAGIVDVVGNILSLLIIIFAVLGIFAGSGLVDEMPKESDPDCPYIIKLFNGLLSDGSERQDSGINSGYNDGHSSWLKSLFWGHDK